MNGRTIRYHIYIHKIFKANGVGRLIHADGDFYEGEWYYDSAHGYVYFYLKIYTGKIFALRWRRLRRLMVNG